jgi:beta-lactamase class A
LVATTRDNERREHLRAQRTGRHRGVGGEESFAGGFNALAELAYAGAAVSASVIDLRTGRTLVSIDDQVAMPTASVGKILLLIEVSARITARDASGFGILDKTPGDAVGDSGIWQQLQAPAFPVVDLALLVGATSDNLATNVLLRLVGLDSVRARGESLGLARTALLDLVRDHRGQDNAPQLSIGSTAELAWLFSALAAGQIVDTVTSTRVLDWLSHNPDLSLVSSAFGLDPLSHRTPDLGLRLIHKTGTDAGVRAEAGLLSGSRSGVSYAVTVQFSETDLAARLRVLDAMRVFGFDLLEYVY